MISGIQTMLNINGNVRSPKPNLRTLLQYTSFAISTIECHIIYTSFVAPKIFRKCP